MRGSEISVSKLESILEESRDLKVRDNTPKRLSKRASRLLVEEDEDVSPEVVLKKRIEVEIDSLDLENIRNHLENKYGAIADPKITNAKFLQASTGYHPEKDHKKMADYRLRLSWGYTPKAFGRECDDYTVGTIKITGKEQDKAVFKEIDEETIRETDDYLSSKLVKKKPRKYRWHPKNLL